MTAALMGGTGAPLSSPTSYMIDEAATTLLPTRGIDIPAYIALLMERFRNPHIRDTLERLATDASDRVPKFLIPVARERSHTGLASPATARAVAGWAAHSQRTLQAGASVSDRQLLLTPTFPPPLAFALV